MYGKITEDATVASFASQILEGLEYLHSKSIIHGVIFASSQIRHSDFSSQNLQADNILLEPSGICKIASFGNFGTMRSIQEFADPTTEGTIFWMAPEILARQCEGGPTPKVDIWSVGCIMLEMWTGVRPWTGFNAQDVMLKVSVSLCIHPVAS